MMIFKYGQMTINFVWIKFCKFDILVLIDKVGWINICMYVCEVWGLTESVWVRSTELMALDKNPNGPATQVNENVVKFLLTWKPICNDQEQISWETKGRTLGMMTWQNLAFYDHVFLQ